MTEGITLTLWVVEVRWLAFSAVIGPTLSPNPPTAE